MRGLSIEAIKKAAEIELVLIDNDGTLTDGSVFYSENGELMKRYSVRDGTGVELLRNNNIKVGIMTREKTLFTVKRAEKLKMEYVFTGVEDKWGLALEILKDLKLLHEQMAFMGDDLNDIVIINNCYLSSCPYNAVNEVKSKVDFVSDYDGGNGAFREFAEFILFSKRLLNVQ